MALPFKLDFMELLLVGDYLMKQMNKVKNKLIIWLVIVAKISAGQGECIEESLIFRLPTPTKCLSMTPL